MRSYKKSLELLERLRRVTPGGAQTLSKRAERFPEGAFPVALSHGDGPYVYDVDGNRYLDMICGLASMTLGYNGRCDDLDYAHIVYQEVVKQIARGHNFSLATELEADVAEKICAMIPCAEMVRFVKSGSEATEAAIRVARKATGKDIILTVGSGYHSWHSWFQAVKPEHPGIPELYTCMVNDFPYNDLAEAERLFKCNKKIDWQLDSDVKLNDGVAAVILEPCHYEQPAPGFLEGLRDLCTKYGALLIFDEMVTGFRWAYGGAQQYYGVTPDLATFGKACANGYPLAFLCGKREYMQHADVVSGTFGGDCIGLAACNTVLDIYTNQPIIETLWERGRQFQDGVRSSAMQTGCEEYVVCDGYPVKPRIKFLCGQTAEADTLAMSLFVQELAERGVLWHPAGGNISAAMTEEDIRFALDGVRESLSIVRRAIDSGDWSALRGKPIQQSKFVRGGA